MSKRIFDLLGSSFGLLVLSPLLLVLAIWVKLDSSGPIFFRQERVGQGGSTFRIHKFRTMVTDAKKKGLQITVGADARVTRVGHWPRKYKLDELPQLLDVWFGDMSLVGPRPLLVQYLQRYSKEQTRRHEVKPGITGWAQVNGRNAISWEEKLRLDVEYVENQSLILDLKILWLTAVNVLHRKNINAGNHVTMQEFKGSTLLNTQTSTLD